MKKILLPTDFSEISLNAIDYALQLYEHEECAFFLLNTYTPMIYNYEYEVTASQFIMEATDMVKKNSQKKLDDLLYEFKKKYNNNKHKFRTISSFNILSDEIIELTEKFTIDLIIMGTKGSSNVKDILFGSNTTHVIRKATCPVLAIPKNFRFEAPKEMLFPTGYNEKYQLKKLDIIKNIAKAYNSKIHMLYTIDNGNDDELTEKQKKNKAEVDSYFTEFTHLFHTIESNDIQGAISKFKLQLNVNFLSMLNSEKSFFKKLFSKSSIYQIALHLNIPLLIIPIK